MHGLSDRSTAIDFLECKTHVRINGCIPGIHEVLRRQGLLEGIWALDSAEVLSPGQADEISRVNRTHPELNDDDFVASHLDEWLSA